MSGELTYFLRRIGPERDKRIPWQGLSSADLWLSAQNRSPQVVIDAWFQRPLTKGSDVTMTQEPKAQKPAKDRYAERGKTLASSAQRLRGWVGSDPSRAPELADTLVLLTSHHLLGHAYAAAAADAQEALRRAAELLTANGPIGPYTSITDATRYVTAVVHLAVVQAGLGLPEAAGQTIESLQEMRQIGDLRLEKGLQPQTAIWVLLCTARAALVSGDIAAANAYADAALTRLRESRLRSEPDSAYLAIDVDRLASDCRWAAGMTEEALGHLYAARLGYQDVVGVRLDEPGRHSPALVERLSEPLFSLDRDMADRLAASGEVDLGLVTRRALIERLRRLTGPLGDPARVRLASALTDLAADLLSADRLDEADAAAAEAASTGRSDARSTRQLLTAIRAGVLTRRGRTGEAVTLLRQVLSAEVPESGSAADAVVLLALVEALQAKGDTNAAESNERAFIDLARNLVGPDIEVTEQAAGPVKDIARGVVSRGPQQLTWTPEPPSASYAATIAARGTNVIDVRALEAERRREMLAWLEAERPGAHRLERDRLNRARAEAERREAAQAEAERAAAEQRARQRAQAEEAARIEAERRAAAEEAERLARKRRREERLEAHRREVERRAAEQREAERIQAERQRADRLAADPAEAERMELERLQAELDELEREEERPS